MITVITATGLPKTAPAGPVPPMAPNPRPTTPALPAGEAKTQPPELVRRLLGTHWVWNNDPKTGEETVEFTDTDVLTFRTDGKSTSVVPYTVRSPAEVEGSDPARKKAFRATFDFAHKAFSLTEEDEPPRICPLRAGTIAPASGVPEAPAPAGGPAWLRPLLGTSWLWYHDGPHYQVCTLESPDSVLWQTTGGVRMHVPITAYDHRVGGVITINASGGPSAFYVRFEPSGHTGTMKFNKNAAHETHQLTPAEAEAAGLPPTSK